MTFHSVGNVMIPTDELIFFRGVGIPPTRYSFMRKYPSAMGYGYVNLCPQMGHQHGIIYKESDDKPGDLRVSYFQTNMLIGEMCKQRLRFSTGPSSHCENSQCHGQNSECTGLA